MKRLLAATLITLAQLNAVNLSGYVTDEGTGESIIGVNVFICNTALGAASDINGFFMIRNVKPGEIELQLSHIAYEPAILPVKLGIKDVYLGKLTLKPQAIQTAAVEIVGQRSQLIQREMDISSFEVDPVVLIETPQLGKDVFRLVKFSPSVTISDPFSPQYYVRGSDPGENLVQLDGMTIYNPQHFMASQAVFNPYAIKNIEMLVGGFDAQYGGRNASILNITSREGHQSEIHGEFKPSTSGISGAVEFPVKPGATAMVSGRLITDLAFRVLMGSPNLMADFNGAYQTRIGSTRIRLSTFLAQDYMNYSIDNLMLFFPDSIFDSFREGFITRTSNRAAGIQLYSVLTPKLLLEAQAYTSGSAVDNKTYFSYQFSDTTEKMDVALDFRTHIRNSIADRTLKANLSYFAFLYQNLQVGFEINALQMFTRMGQLQVESARRKSDLTVESMFLQDKIEWGAVLFKAGARFSRYHSETAFRREPRFSLAIKWGGLTFKAAYGRYYQYLTTMDSKNNEFVQFLDYYTSLHGYEPINSIHRIVSLEGKIHPRLEYSLTAYHKDLRVLYRYMYEQFQVDDQTAATIEQGSGEASGFEVLLRGEIGRLSGWIGYNYAHGTRRYPSVLNNRKVLFDGDQPHNFKSLLLYKLTEDITASSTLQITSGFPRTWETGMMMWYDYDPLENRLGLYPTQITPVKNNVRYPPRLTWDVGWKKRLRNGFGYYLAEYLSASDPVFTMTIQNILFLHRNPQWYFYIPDFGYYALDFEMIPSVSASYSIRF